MCGRYAASADPSSLVEEFAVDVVGDVAAVSAPRYNIAPTAPVATVVTDEVDGRPARVLCTSRWGLEPPWARKPMRLINARVETVTEKPSFRAAIRRRRCVLPALGYYEWREETADGARVKQPWFLHPRHGSLAMAGIHEFHETPDGWIRTTAILTTDAADGFGWLHERMPMAVPRDALDEWLDPTQTDGAQAVALLAVPDLERPRRVSRRVNRVGVEGPELIEPVGE